MEWIKLKDKFPPENVWILGSTTTNMEMGIWFGVKEGFKLPDFSYMSKRITHWMPLPDLPK